jgi:hypothetical protein
MDTGLWLVLIAASASGLVILLALLRRRLVLGD